MNDDLKYRHHIGSASYVLVTDTFSCVDMHEFYQPKDKEMTDIQPNRRGIALLLSEWQRLKETIPKLHEALSAIATTEWCWMKSDHLNQMGFYEGKECSPFKALFLRINMSRRPGNHMQIFKM